MADIPFWDEFTEGYDGPESDPNPWGQVWLGGFRLPGICRVDGAATHRIDVQKANGADGATLIERGYEPSSFDIDMTIWTPRHWNLWREIRPQIFRRPNKSDVGDHRESREQRASRMQAEKALARARSDLALAEKAERDAVGAMSAARGIDRVPAEANLFIAERNLTQARQTDATAEADLAKVSHHSSKTALPVSHPALDDAGISACLIKSITLPRPGPDVGSMVITIKCIEHVLVTRASANRRVQGVTAPPKDRRFDNASGPARNKPVKPSDAGDGRPGGAAKVTRGDF